MSPLTRASSASVTRQQTDGHYNIYMLIVCSGHGATFCGPLHMYSASKPPKRKVRLMFFAAIVSAHIGAHPSHLTAVCKTVVKTVKQSHVTWNGAYRRALNNPRESDPI